MLKTIFMILIFFAGPTIALAAGELPSELKKWGADADEFTGNALKIALIIASFLGFTALLHPNSRSRGWQILSSVAIALLVITSVTNYFPTAKKAIKKMMSGKASDILGK